MKMDCAISTSIPWLTPVQDYITMCYVWTAISIYWCDESFYLFFW